METEEQENERHNEEELEMAGGKAPLDGSKTARAALGRSSHPIHMSSSTASSCRVSWMSAASTSATSTVSSSAQWSLDVERHRRLHMWPAGIAANQPVPDIVVEHVPSSSFADTRHSAIPGMSPPFSAGSAMVTQMIIGRQARALSDSSVHDVEKSQMGSSPPRCCSSYSSRTPELLDLSTTTSTSACSSVSRSAMQSFDRKKLLHARTVTLSEEVPSGMPFLLPLTLGVANTFAGGQRQPGPEKSPKANWLRRHSDSNLAAGPCWSGGGLRLEPYPIRSHSTGDTLSAVADRLPSGIVPVFPTSDSGSERRSQLNQTTTYQQHSEPYLVLHSSSQLWQQHLQQQRPTIGTFWPERASSLVVKKFSSEGSQPRPSIETERRSANTGRCLSDQGPYARHAWMQAEMAKAVEPTEDLSEYKSQPVEESGSCSTATLTAGTDETLPENLSVHSTQRSKSSSDIPEGSGSTIAERTERSAGLMEKRLKLKKYLQARYQMSLHQLRRNSDTDEVFAERYSSPDLSAQYLLHAHDPNQPEDLSKRTRTVVPGDSADEEHWRHRHLSATAARDCSSKSESEETLTRASQSPPEGFSEESTDSSHILPMEELVMVKPEPMSPGIVPSGTSVFVFPPPNLPAYSEFGSRSRAEWYRAPLSADSPLPSPVAAASERSHWRSASSRQERSSYASDEGLGYRFGSFPQSLPMSADLPSVSQHLHRFRPPLEIGQLPEYPGSISTSESLPPTPHFYRTEGTTRAASESWDDPGARTQLHLSRRPYTPPALERQRFRETRAPRSRRLVSLSAEESFTCPVCSVAFPSYRHLTDHMAEHVSATSPPESGLESDSGIGASGAKPVHLCPICQRAFSRGDMLTRHVRLHTGIRPYECNLCSQVFSRSDHLTTHQRTHTGEKPYRCPICAYAAPRRDMVTRHARIHESSSSGSGRRGRRTASICSPLETASGGGVRGARQVSAITSRQVAPRRQRSDSSGFISRRPQWSHAVGEEEMPIDFVPNRWSLASSIESGESSTAAAAVAPVTCRAWSTTSAESFESYPGAAAHSSSLSSVADSPDVFTVHPRYFRWGSELNPPGESSTSLEPGDLERSSVDVAGVMPALQKCSVASPLMQQDTDTGEAD